MKPSCCFWFASQEISVSRLCVFQGSNQNSFLSTDKNIQLLIAFWFHQCVEVLSWKPILNENRVKMQGIKEMRLIFCEKFLLCFEASSIANSCNADVFIVDIWQWNFSEKKGSSKILVMNLLKLPPWRDESERKVFLLWNPWTVFWRLRCSST